MEPLSAVVQGLTHQEVENVTQYVEWLLSSSENKANEVGDLIDPAWIKIIE